MSFFSVFGNTTPIEDPLDFGVFFKEIRETLTNSELWIVIGGKIIWAIVLVIVAMIVTRVLNRVIDNFFRVKGRSRLKGTDKRNQTIVNVLQNAATVFVWFVAIMMVLETFSLPVRTLLAGAGVVGLAIGFGAQSLVKDMITGFFILLENQFDKGDFIRVNASGATVAEGEVLSLGLRATRIQGWEGELFIIPNGTINEVVNFSRYNAISMLDVNVSIKEDLNRIESILESFFTAHWQEHDALVAKPEVLGLQGIENGEAIMRVMLETKPMEQFGATRDMRKAIKTHLIEQGIQISVPKVDIQQFDVTKNEGE